MERRTAHGRTGSPARGRRAVARGTLRLAAALALALAAPAIADDDACRGCHGDRAPIARFAASAHGPLGCAVCHTDITDFPHPERPAPPDCTACHGDVVAAHARSAHGKAAAGGAPRVGCADCHGDVHAVVAHGDRASAVHWAQVAGTCARCHAGTPQADGFRIPVVRPVEAYLESAHARAVTEGRRGAMCADCHGAHDVVPATDPSSRLWPANVAATCGACHQAIASAYRDSIHGAALAGGVRDAPTCTDCHGEHAILPHTDPASPVYARNIPGETCGRCHRSLRLSAKYGLPGGRVASYEDSYHGLALHAGKLTAANCASCHGVHDIQPSSNPRSHVHAQNLPATCGTCHPGAGTNFALGPVHVLPDTASGTAVGWIRFVYLWMIGLVVGGMALHNALDLQRKARRTTPPPPPPAGPVAERMPRALRLQHQLVVLSFVGLVYTGFALTYPDHWWAAPVLGWETRLGLRGLLHRGLAVVMLAAVAWHVVLLATDARLRRCFAGMLWSRRDLRELRERIAWMLGRRAHPPRTGTFGYVEKAEYWAFMWGTALMGVTGLVLWFENLSLRWLPKWVTDVATALHFYEAVLATLAIVVWHLYWVVFDPDVYPMDTTWLRGRPPAARQLERTGEPPPDGG